jgi:hypothetical protein
MSLDDKKHNKKSQIENPPGERNEVNSKQM